MRTEGQEIHELLAQFFGTDPKTRPHFQLGFKALRRAEMEQLCKRAGITGINFSRSADEIVQIMNAYLMEGRFDHLKPKPPADEMAELRRQIAELQALVTQLEKGRDKLTLRKDG